MTARLINGAGTLLGWSVAAGAWALFLAAYPFWLAFAYALRVSWGEFLASLDELAESWEARQEAAA